MLATKARTKQKRRCAHRLVSFPPELLWKILITLHPTDVHTVCRTLGINGFTNSFDFAVRNLKYHGLTAEVLSEITWNHLDITFVAALLTSIPINHGVLLLLCMDSGPNSPCERHGEMVKEAVDIVFERMGKDITKWKGMCHPLAVSFLVAIGAVEVLRALLDNMAMHRRCFREYLESAFDMALRKRFKEAAGLLVRYTGFIRSRHEKDAALAAFRYAVAFEGQEEVDKALGNLVIVPGLAVRAVEDAGFANDGEMERIVGSLRELVRRPEFQDGFRVNFGLVGKRRLLMEELFRWDQITNGDQALDVMDVETFKWMLSNKESLSWWVATSLRSTVDLMRKFGEKGRTDLVEVLLEDAEGPEIIKKAKVAFEVGLTKGNVELVKMVMERYEVVEDSRCLRTLFKFGVFPRYHMSEYNSSSEDEIDGKALHMEQLDLVGDLAARKSEILGILLESPYVDPSAYQNLAFRKAVYMQNAPLVKKLLDHPRLTLPRNCDKLLKNPLSAAVAKLLVGCGRFQLHKLCQLEFALRHGETGLLEALLEPNCFDEKFKQEMFLHAACRRGDIEGLKKFVEVDKFDPSFNSNMGLFYAVENQKAEVVTYLLADERVRKGLQGDSAKQVLGAFKSLNGNADEAVIVREIINNSGINFRVYHIPESMLLPVARAGDLETVKKVLNLREFDISGAISSSLILAISHGHFDTFVTILEQPYVWANVPVKSLSFGSAVRFGNLRVMLYLLALDGFTHEPWAHGNLFVHLSDAIRNTPITGDPIGCLKVLMKDERFNPAMNGCEAVMHAVWSGSGSMVKLLIKDERVCALVTPKMREILFGQIGMDDKKRGFEVIEALMGDKEWWPERLWMDGPDEEEMSSEDEDDDDEDDGNEYTTNSESVGDMDDYFDPPFLSFGMPIWMSGVPGVFADESDFDDDDSMYG